MTPGTPAAMRPALRWALLGAAGAAIAVAWLPEEEAAVAAPAVRLSPAMPAASAMPAMPAMPTTLGMPARVNAAPAAVAPVAALDAGLAVAAAGMPWQPLSRAAQLAWAPAPQPRPAAAASAPVVVVAAPTPTFPFQWIGQIDEAGRVRVFLADTQRLWAVAPGETVEPGWRVDGINAGRLQVTWLATGAAVQLAARP